MGNRTHFEHYINPDLGAIMRALKLDVEFVRGEGTVLYDSNNRAYLDFVAGFGAVPFGHQPKNILAALGDFAQGSLPALVQPSALGPAGRLAKQILEITPSGLDYVWFANSGTETVEASIKAARVATGRSLIISAEKGFHGKTLGSLSATARPHFQQPFGAPVEGFSAVPFGDIAALEACLKAHRRQVAAVILEPIQGEGGINVAPEGYFTAVRQLCDQHGALLIVDEVQTGLGRTGDMFAIEHEHVMPDMLLLAKALGGGIVPIGACVMNRRSWTESFGMRHSSTFAGNALACQVAQRVLHELTTDDRALLRNVKERSEQLAAIHQGLVERYPQLLSGWRGRGLMQGLCFKLTRDTFRSGWGTTLGLMGEQGNLIMLLASYLLNVHGLRTAPTLSSGQVMRVEPPLTVTKSECERYGDAMEKTLNTLAQGDTSAMLDHLIHGERKQITPSHQALRPMTKPVDDAHGLNSRFAFLIHPIDYGSYMEFDESLRAFDQHQMEELSEQVACNLEPDILASTVIESETGTKAYGEFACIMATARNFLEMDGQKAIDTVCEAVQLAKKRGAKIVGLGGFTSVITQGGLKAAGDGVAVTTGNSYTVISAVEAMEMACRQLGEPFQDLSVAVVGAGGAIGGAVAALLLSEVSELTLVGNPANPDKAHMRVRRLLQRALPAVVKTPAHPLAQAIAAHPSNPGATADARAWMQFAEQLLTEDGAVVPLRSSVDLNSVIPHCKVVITATSSPLELIQPEILAPGAIICDMSRPSNTSRRVLEARPDVLVIDGGVVEIPGRPYLGFNFGFPRGIGYACMAETMMLALDENFNDTSLGADLTRETLDYMRGLAKKHGFKLAGLRSFDRVMSGVDWKSLRQARAERMQSGGAPAKEKVQTLSERMIRAPAHPESVSDAQELNVTYWLLDQHLGSHRADKAAIVATGQPVTYAELAEHVAAAVALLQAQGISKGDCVGLMTHDCTESLAIVLAAMRVGAFVSYFNPFLKSEDCLPLIDYAQPRILLINEELSEALSPGLMAAGKSWLPLLQTVSEYHGASLKPAEKLAAATPAICLFSSGSTGRPKAVRHSHRDILNTNLNYVPAILGLDENAITCSASRMFFAYGFNSVHFALFAGGTALLAPARPQPERLFEMIEHYRPTVFFTVPTVLLLMLQKQDRERDLSCLQRVVSAGEPLPVDLFDAWQARFGHEVIDGIGCTESLSTYISNAPGDVCLGSTGKVVPGFDIRLTTSEGQDAGIGEIGTLWLRGNTLSPGYWRDEAVTRQVFRDGWFCTNDMFHRDSHGWFYYMGRANDMIKVGGCWVSPTAIEQAVRDHEAVSESAVVAREAMGSLMRPVAFVVLNPGQQPSTELAEAIKHHARTHLPPQQYPHFVEFIDALPKTASGKVQRYRLRNLDRQRVAVEVQAVAG